MWHSFDYGLAHIVMGNTETDFPGSPEGPGTKLGGGPFGGAGGIPSLLSWLDSDLSKASQSRSTVPWIIVCGHRPFYNSGGSEANDAILKAFEDILIKYKVDIVFAGHVHLYERLFPISKGVPQVLNGTIWTNPKAPTFLISGAAGNDEGHLTNAKDGKISAYLDNTNYGYGRLTVVNRTAVHWEFFASSSRTRLDEVWIVQTNN